MSGDYRVEVILGNAVVVLSWSGYADNITDALYHAINAREDELNKNRS